MRVKMLMSHYIKKSSGAKVRFECGSVIEVDEDLAKQWMESYPIVAWPEGEGLPSHVDAATLEQRKKDAAWLEDFEAQQVAKKESARAAAVAEAAQTDEIPQLDPIEEKPKKKTKARKRLKKG